MKKNCNEITILLIAFLVLLALAGIGTAAEIIVQSGNSIQAAVSNSVSGDIIIVMPGTYSENIKVPIGNLTIRSESGNPDNTKIKSMESGADVFLLQADSIQINGFKISGATATPCSAINLSSCRYCTIENNKLLNNARGINLLSAHLNMISNNTVTNNTEYGIVLGNAAGNIISGNTVYNNARGIYIGSSDSNTLSGNTVRDNSFLGLYICPKSDRNTIYDNYFNDVNISIKNGYGNFYNTAKTAGTNIVGGPYIGGNYWAKPDSTGFSQKAVDTDGDGISDSAYTNISGSVYSDFLPLVTPRPAPINPVADFSSNVTSGDAPLNVGFTDNGKGATSWAWDFGDGNNSKEQNPVHTYSTLGKYTVTLTASNTNGTDSKLSTITVLEKPAPVHPVANFIADITEGTAPLSVQFADMSTGSPTSWVWDFGDGASATGRNVSHTYRSDGSYTVDLTIANVVGSDTEEKIGYIFVKKTVNSGTDNKTNTSNKDVNPDADTETGNKSINPGTDNKTNTCNKDVKPVSPKTVAAFCACSISGNAPLKVKFTDKSTGKHTSWKWNFGDGTYSTCKNPVHTYCKSGKYTVTLTVKDAKGNTVKTSKYIVVAESPRKECAKNTKKVCKDTKKVCKDTKKVCKDTKKVCKDTKKVCKDTKKVCNNT